MDYAVEAQTLFRQGFNCSQAVFASRAGAWGLDPQIALKLASGFGGGIGCTGQICGALSGACMLIGLKYGAVDPADKATKQQTYQRVERLCGRFRQETGHIECKDLLGFDLSTPEGKAAARLPGALDRCPEYVRIAAQLADEELGKPNP